MINKISIILVLSSLVCCLGKPECGLESCDNLETVKKCGNVQECINNVWLKEKSPVYHEDVCDTCISMVKQARDVLMSNDTLDLIKQVFEGSCALLKIPKIVKYCDKFADEYAQELVAMLASQMDPDTVCTVARLCSTHNPNNVPKECTNCQYFFEVASLLLEKVTFKEFEQELFKVCRNLGSYSDACFYYAPLFAGFLLNQTKHAVENHPCEALDICPKNTIHSQLLPVRSSYKEDKQLLCSLCPSAMSSFKTKLDKIKSFEEFKKDGLKVCSSLSLNPSSCDEILDSYIHDVYIYMSQHFDPAVICSSNLICSDDRKSDGIPDYPLLPTTDNRPTQLSLVDIIGPSIALEVAPKKETKPKQTIDFGDVIGTVPVLLATTNVGAIQCKSCFKIFDSVHSLMNSRRDFVEEFAQSVCFSMPDFGSCFQLIELYLKKFVHKFEDMTDSSKVCSQLVPECSLEQTILSEGDICTDCITAFDIIREAVSGQFAQNEIINSASEICYTVPSQWESTCHKFVNSTVTKALHALEQAGGNETCSFLKMCSASTSPAPSPPSKGSCKICMLVIQTIYDEMENPANEAEVEKLLGTVCSSLPSHLRSECHKVVDSYAEQIVDLILQNLKPAEVCRRINFCPRNLSRSPATAIQQTAINQHDLFKPKIPCSFCISAVSTLLDELGDKKTEDQIKQLLDKLCAVMPNEVQDTCKGLVSQFSDQIIDMILADFNASEICTFLKLCGPKTTTPTFKIFTNEVSTAYNPSAACEFCRFLQLSLNVKENKDKTAETMMAFLEDVCLADKTNKFGVCKNKTTEILPRGKSALLHADNICDEYEICAPKKANDLSQTFENVRRAVQECAMCEFLVSFISSHEKMIDSEYDFTKHAPAVCASVPQDKISMCESFMVSYGPSIVHLLKNTLINGEELCGYMNLCDKRQLVKLGKPVSEVIDDTQTNLQTSSCHKGPDFWCKNEENARLCGTYLHCQEAVWKNGVPPSVEP